MQDRYAADVGDFLKLGLLRQLTAPSVRLPTLRLGVVWYRVLDESHNADGKHVAYLSQASAAGRALRRLDANLYDKLADVVRSGPRSVAALEQAGVLPNGSLTFNEALAFGHLSTLARSQREVTCSEWMSRALRATEACDLIFVDPDNGIRRTDHRVPADRNKAEKHAYFGELRQFTARGQSLVAYHHADRSTTVEQQAQRRMADAAEQLEVRPLAAVRASRGTNRLFLILPVDLHRTGLTTRLLEVERSSWANELKVYWWQPNEVGTERDGAPDPDPASPDR